MHGSRRSTGRLSLLIPYQADLLQGSWLSELLDHVQYSVVHPCYTDALHTGLFQYLGFAGLLESRDERR